MRDLLKHVFKRMKSLNGKLKELDMAVKLETASKEIKNF